MGDVLEASSPSDPTQHPPTSKVVDSLGPLEEPRKTFAPWARGGSEVAPSARSDSNSPSPSFHPNESTGECPERLDLCRTVAALAQLAQHFKRLRDRTDSNCPPESPSAISET